MENVTDDTMYFGRSRKGRAEFIRPPNTIKIKVGSGGLDETTLDRAEAILEENAADFTPMAEIYLDSLLKAVENAQKGYSVEKIQEFLNALLYPSMQLKAEGSMFHYPLVSKMADKLIRFLESVEEPDENVLEIVRAFHQTIEAVIMGKLNGHGGQKGQEFMDELDSACRRYFSQAVPRHTISALSE